jgi:REP element-mobilizing transposase RayT
MKTKIYHRRSVRLTGYDYAQNGCYFLTICTRNRECLFGEIQNANMILSDIGTKVNECWLDIPNHFPQIVLHDYVIMPNHVHGIIEINNIDAIDSNIGIVVGANNYSPTNYSPLRSSTNPASLSSRPNGTSRTVGSVVRGFKIGVTKQMGFSPWQRNYYEHIIRNGESYNTIVQYMDQNPMKWEEDCFYNESQKAVI